MQHLGTKIEKLRCSKGLSIEDVSIKCDLTENQLLIIESGEAIPSLSVLIKICHCLEISIGTLLDGIEVEGVAVTRNGKRPEAINMSSGIHDDTANSLEFYSMAPTKSNRHMEPFIIYINRNDNKQELSSHEGEEFIYIISGELELTHGDTKTVVKEGDSVYYDSIIPHKICSISDKSKVIAVIYTPL